MEKIRTCKICGVTSETDEFYRGVTSRCKECHKAKVRENRANNVEYYRAYDAKRFQEDPKVKERHLRYQKTEAGMEAMRRGKKKWVKNNREKISQITEDYRRNNPEKYHAHYKLGNAIKLGKIQRPDGCGYCGSTEQTPHGHHEDYSQPLNVVWCCAKCHADIHKGVKKVKCVNGQFMPDLNFSADAKRDSILGDR